MNAPKETVLRYVLSQVDVVKEWEPHALRGADPEGVHKMRVAIRRTRSIVREFRQALPDEVRVQYNGELRWVARRLGRARDADICLESLQHYEARFTARNTGETGPLATYIGTTRTEAYDRLRGALSSERYAMLIEGLRDLAVESSADPAARGRGHPSVAPEDHVERATARVFDYGKRITEDSTAAELHRLRIAVKRLRYLLDFLAAYDSGSSARLAEITRDLQELLGEHQDAIIVQEVLAAYEESSRTSGVPMDDADVIREFMRQLAARTIDCRRRFPEIWTQFANFAS